MFYRYETHLHTAETSLCGQTGAEEMIRAFHQAGYAGVVVTDHFFTSKSYGYRDLPRAEQLERFFKGFELARRTGEALGMTVFPGFELTRIPQMEDYLVYGLSVEVLLAHPDIGELPIEQFCALAHENDAFIIRAHPYRETGYIPGPAEVNPDIIDAIEVNNGYAGDPENHNDLAWAFARQHPTLVRTAGTDIHDKQYAGVSGMAFERRLQTMSELIDALRAGEGYLIIDGQIIDREGNLVSGCAG